MAVGASRASVLVLVLRRGGRLAGLGLVLGAAGAVAGSRLVRAQLFETGPSDPATYAGAFLLLTLIAFVACIVPAWRATRIDPVEVLRGE
jgi:putative ABC transport system permease protein